jgi:hypothetical protein
MEMLGTLDGDNNMPAELVETLRCLFGRSGGGMAARLSFLNQRVVRLPDLDQAIAKLLAFRRCVPEVAKDAVDHGVSRLEEMADQMANMMEEQNLTEITITPQPA